MRKFTFAISAAALAFAGAAIAQPGMEQGMGEHRMPQGDMTRAQAQQHAEAMFDKMDANHDGTLDPADRAAHEAMMFDKIDTDRNGSISRAEFDGFHAKMGERMGGKMGKMAHGARGAAMMGKTDSPVTRQAFVARALTMFDKADANHDGIVTQAERQAARQTMRRQWQARKAARPQG